MLGTIDLAVKYAIEAIVKWTDENVDMATQTVAELASLDWQQVINDRHDDERDTLMSVMKRFLAWWEQGGNCCEHCEESYYVGGYHHGPLCRKTYMWPHTFSPYSYLSYEHFIGKHYCRKCFMKMQSDAEAKILRAYRQEHPESGMAIWQNEMWICEGCERLIPYKSRFAIGNAAFSHNVYCLHCVPIAVEQQFTLCSHCHKKTASVINGLCHDCYDIEFAFKQCVSIQQLSTHLGRAKKAKTPATLTLKQWANTVTFFDWKCAYCQSRSFEVLEHFLPISLGGGTTVDNCVPACVSCNVKKGDRHPDKLIHFVPSAHFKSYSGLPSRRQTRNGVLYPFM